MNSVIKGSGYCLSYTPGLMLHNGSTITTEKVVNPDGEFLKEMGKHVRSYEDCVAYWPNQVYIGNADPEELRKVEFPYYDKKFENASRYGRRRSSCSSHKAATALRSSIWRRAS